MNKVLGILLFSIFLVCCSNHQESNILVESDFNGNNEYNDKKIYYLLGLVNDYSINEFGNDQYVISMCGTNKDDEFIRVGNQILQDFNDKSEIEYVNTNTISPYYRNKILASILDEFYISMCSDIAMSKVDSKNKTTVKQKMLKPNVIDNMKEDDAFLFLAGILYGQLDINNIQLWTYEYSLKYLIYKYKWGEIIENEKNGFSPGLPGVIKINWNIEINSKLRNIGKYF